LAILSSSLCFYNLYSISSSIYYLFNSSSVIVTLETFFSGALALENDFGPPNLNFESASAFSASG